MAPVPGERVRIKRIADERVRFSHNQIEPGGHIHPRHSGYPNTQGAIVFPWFSSHSRTVKVEFGLIVRSGPHAVWAEACTGDLTLVLKRFADGLA